MRNFLLLKKRITSVIFLSIVGLFFCGLYKSNVAFADSARAKTSHSSGHDNMGAPLTTCKGTSSLHNTTRKVVALTFDDGPHEKYTKQILEILRLNDIKGTFFFVGKNVKQYPEVVKAVYLEGSVVGNHTYSHHQLNRLAGEGMEQEMTKTGELINKTIGVYPALFRPPYGACSAGSVRVARNLHLKTIMWSAMVDDYHVDRTTSVKIASQILNLVHPGAIIGLHDGGGKREKTVEALQIIIKVLKSEGYEFVTVPELLNIQPYLEPEPQET